MTMHHIDVSPRFDLPADDPTRRTFSSRTSATDPSVCEWAVDLSVGTALTPVSDAPASLAATGFVDFDAIETVHVSLTAARPE